MWDSFLCCCMPSYFSVWYDTNEFMCHSVFLLYKPLKETFVFVLSCLLSSPYWLFSMYSMYLEKTMAPHSSTLAWKIPWTEEPRRLQSMGSLKVGHDWATSLSLFTFMHWRRKWNPLQYSCLENPRDEGAWWAAIYGVAQSWTWLKRLSSSSSRCIWGLNNYCWSIIHILFKQCFWWS